LGAKERHDNRIHLIARLSSLIRAAVHRYFNDANLTRVLDERMKAMVRDLTGD
jgi:hypothetical protein